MRLFLVSLSLALLALSLAAYCFVQIPLIKDPIAAVISNLEDQLLADRSKLSQPEAERPDAHLWVLRFDTQALNAAHTNLWRAGVLGFLGLGIANLVVAGVAYKKHKLQNATAPGDAPPLRWSAYKFTVLVFGFPTPRRALCPMP